MGKPTGKDTGKNNIVASCFDGRSEMAENSKSIHFYDSITEFAADTKTPHENHKETWERYEGYDSEFRGATATETRKRVEKGWPEAIRKIDKLSDKIAVDLVAKTRKRKKKRGDFGEEYDLHRAYSGSYETAWDRLEKRQVTGPSNLTIVSDLTISAWTKHEELFWRGAASVALVDILENAGYQVEVLTVFCGTNDHSDMERKDRPTACQIVTKRHDMPLDKESLAGAICCPGFLRLYAFQWNCTFGDVPITSGLWAPPFDSDKYFKYSPECIGGLSSVRDEITAIQWLKNSIKYVQESQLEAV